MVFAVGIGIIGFIIVGVEFLVFGSAVSDVVDTGIVGVAVVFGADCTLAFVCFLESFVLAFAFALVAVVGTSDGVASVVVDAAVSFPGGNFGVEVFDIVFGAVGIVVAVGFGAGGVVVFVVGVVGVFDGVVDVVK